MKKVDIYEIEITTMCQYDWSATFLFKPTLADIMVAISEDIAAASGHDESMDESDVDHIGFIYEQMMRIREIALHLDDDSIGHQRQIDVRVAGITVGTSAVTVNQAYNNTPAT